MLCNSLLFKHPVPQKYKTEYRIQTQKWFIQPIHYLDLLEWIPDIDLKFSLQELNDENI